MQHSFNTKIAEKYGMAAATILNHLYFWIKKNAANDDNFHDGLYWTYCSRDGFEKLFTYLSARQIDYAIRKLIDGGIIVTGNYNKSTYDRTLWYAITKVGYSILQNCEMEETNLSNGSDKIVPPIPNRSSNIKAKDSMCCKAQAREDDTGDGDIEDSDLRQESEDNLEAFNRFVKEWGIQTRALRNYSGGKLAGIDWDAISERVGKSDYLQKQKAVSFYIDHADEILDGKYFDYVKPRGSPRSGNHGQSDDEGGYIDPDYDWRKFENIHYD